MNTDRINIDGSLFTRLLTDGHTDEMKKPGKSRKKIRLRNILCFIAASASVISYGAVVYYRTEEISKSDFIRAVCGDVLEISDEISPVTADISAQTDETDEVSPTLSADFAAEETADCYPIISRDMSSDDIFSLSNQTSFNPDTKSLLSVSASVCESDEPFTVLIVHTHGTEAFTAEGKCTYDGTTSFRSSDTSENVVAVGDEVTEVLTERGIPVIHIREMFDIESYVDSYSRCAAAVSECISENPSVKYVLDIHRDAVFGEDLSLIRPESDDGCAQVMIVAGTSEMGADFPDWENNLAFALRLQKNASEKYSGLMRNINLRGASFNEQLAERFLLVEIGSAGNTLSSSVEAGRRFAEAFCDTVAG